jgi:uncharacterized protein
VAVDQEVASGRAGTRPARLAIYDTDVHHGWRGKADLMAYLSGPDRERFDHYGVDCGLVPVASNGGIRGYRADVLVDGKVPEGAGVTAPSAALTREQLLDGCGIEWALLTGSPVGGATTGADVDYASTLLRAFNDFTVDHWLAADDRFRYAMPVNPRDPEGAAAEIARLGDHPAVVAVLLPGGSQLPYGQRFYRPIHDACAARDLALAIHFNSEGHGVNASPTAAGYPAYYAENRIARAASYKANIASFVFEGVFERLPSFRLAILEAGFAWIPAFLWSMDDAWVELREQTPWVKRPPSEYVLGQVRFASQPEDEPTPNNGLVKTLEWMHAETTLMFASDYPHWDWDNPAETLTGLPVELRQRLFSENAKEFFRH